MSDKKGFTLIEIIVVLVIIGILAAIALPNYFTMMTQGAAKAAENNLLTIYNAQKNYYFSNSSYYNSASTPNDTLLNTNLSLNINDNNFYYACTAAGSSFTCTATNVTSSSFTLAVTNASIVLPGGTNCVSAGPSPCNPVCVDAANPVYCPSS